MALYVETWAVTSYDVQHATINAFPLTHQVSPAAAHSQMGTAKEFHHAVLHYCIPVLKMSPNITYKG